MTHMQQRLTAHFSVAEFIASDTAARHGIDNSLPAELFDAAVTTCEMLESVRTHLGDIAQREVPIVITSGYRCLALNARIGSKPTSDHTRAQAADIRAPAFGRPQDIAKALLPHLDQLGIGQVIVEYPGPSEWLHLSVRRPDKAINRVITITAAGIRTGIHSA